MWTYRITGYTSHTLSSDGTSLVTNFHNTTGAILYSLSVDKSGNTLSAGEVSAKSLASASGSTGVILAVLVVCAMAAVVGLFVYHGMQKQE